jgi:hypothetical protein
MTQRQSLVCDRSCALSHRLRLRQPVASADGEVAAERDSDVIGSLMSPSHNLDINRIGSVTTVLASAARRVAGLPKRGRVVVIDCEPTTRGVGHDVPRARCVDVPGPIRDRPTPNESDWPTASTVSDCMLAKNLHGALVEIVRLGQVRRAVVSLHQQVLDAVRRQEDRCGQPGTAAAHNQDRYTNFGHTFFSAVAAMVGPARLQWSKPNAGPGARMRRASRGCALRRRTQLRHEMRPAATV